MTLRPGLGATYRVQLGPDLSFGDAAALIPYLSRLGIETLYCSPVAEAVPRSTHGYDGTDPTRLRRELGGEEGYDAIVAACGEHGLGICLDIVPNHLATWPGGPWWRRLLAEGPESEMAPVFDVAWDVGVPGKVTLPLLDRPLRQALATGQVRLADPGDTGEEAVMWVGEVGLPVAGGAAGPGDDLADVLDAQHYRLVDWHDERDRNYRRFFDIDGLVGVRVETADVFERTHALVIHLATTGRLSAVRVDHVDGLREPTTYLHRLAAATGVPIVVEKILSGDERLHPAWPVRGTTGYEAIDDVGGVLVDADGLDRLAAAGRAEGEPDPHELTVDTRRFVADDRFPGEVERMSGSLGVAPPELGATASRLTRYRTYLHDGLVDAEGRGDRDEWEVAAARAGAPGVAAAVLDPANRPAVLGLQQLTGAIMAKGIEDTAWYRLAGPLSFCEVGGAPGRDRRDAPARLHARAATRAATGRGGLLPGTTHDTKRAQDVRCRLYALTELAGAFEEGLGALRTALGLPRSGGDLAFETRFLAQLLLGMLPTAVAAGAGRRGASSGHAGVSGGTAAGGGSAGGRGLGDAGWPGDDELASRLGETLRKSSREAKVRSSWTQPDDRYEARLVDLGTRALADGGHLVRASFGPLVAEVARLGAIGSLASIVLRSVLPGVPDCYQGDEVWDLSLVDPDNRRRVDFASLASALGTLDAAADAADLRRSWPDGRVKLFVTSRCLRARTAAGRGLDPGASYLPLAVEGPAAGALLALARRGADGRWVVAVVTRRGAMLAAPEGDLPAGPSYARTRVALPDGAPAEMIEMLSGAPVAAVDASLAVDDILAALPVGLLTGSGTPP